MAEQRQSELQYNMSIILVYIRFPMIFPQQLAEFEQSAFLRAHHDVFSPYLLSAYTGSLDEPSQSKL